MTEEEWLACIDPAVMLKFLDGKFSERKLRLFAVGLCRLRWDRIFAEGVKELVALAEQYAERKTTYREWIDAFHSVSCAFTRHVAWPYVQKAAFEVSKGWLMVIGRKGQRRRQAHRLMEAVSHCNLLRDIFGDPFQIVLILSAWLRWNDGTIPKLAQAIYDDRTFDRLPLLADALEEAGCDNQEILDHCRSNNEHVRGCWVVDLILGKS
jgi:hypothetical protein